MRDLTNQRFGRLVVEKKTKERKNDSIVWKCLCDCGGIIKVRSSSLVDGGTQSCGCLAIESGNKSIKNTIEYNINNEWKDGTYLSLLTSKVSVLNKSNVKGVWWSKQRGKWESYIQLKGKRINLGRYDKLEDAARARKEAEEKYFKPILEKYGRDTESHELFDR